MKYFALSLMVVLAMASVSMADYTVDLGSGVTCDVTEETLEYGLSAYTLHFNGTQGFRNLEILSNDKSGLGAVHQVWAANPATGETPFLGDLPGSLAPAIDPTPYDTHFLFAKSGVVIPPSTDTTMLETCTGANEKGLSDDYISWTTNPAVPGCYPGMGTFDTNRTTEPLEFAFSGTLDPAGYDILRVVIPTPAGAEDTLYLAGECGVTGGFVGVDVPIGVPEPGTVVMLIAGAMCLLGIRRK